VLQPNVIEYGCDIWIQKWVCVDSLNTITFGDSASKSGVQYFEKMHGLGPLNGSDSKGEETTQIDENTLKEHIQYEKAAQ